jgi:hypothetical protein
MDKPWFNLNPNNYNDRWWKYSSILSAEADKTEKHENNIVCRLILQDVNFAGHIYWRCSTWYKNDPNRYNDIIYRLDWPFDVSLVNMKENDIIVKNDSKYKVHYCKFSNADQIDFCKILERIEE